MHIRRKPWARPELAACDFYISDPTARRGEWAGCFARRAPLHLELGCGKGGFLSELAPEHPEINFLGVDINSDVLGLAKRKLEAAYAARGLTADNVRILSWDIERIGLMLAPQDRVERIYINFCNPWPKRAQHKKRLTHPRQLRSYAAFLAPGGEIRFKTDDDGLFEDSLGYFEESGYQVVWMTRNLAACAPADNIVTEHERMFSEMGIPIKACIARLEARP
ncbi:MAG: tRNA (guanosine(46)-N7)-methyltransferase TrmB [Oscillospiraceae bacterium]|nr:tRNA (guanosine(46)-N7)-methyltransferase TrmB [Oscillospiraceae bacterium]